MVNLLEIDYNWNVLNILFYGIYLNYNIVCFIFI